jgi:hypothetical protein
MVFENRCDAIFDVRPARWPPYLFALRLRFAGNGCPSEGNLLKSRGREFERLGDAIVQVFPARGPPDLLLLGLRFASESRLF